MQSLIHIVSGRPWAIRAELAAHVRGLIAREGIAGLRHLAELKHEVHACDGEDGRPRAARRGGSAAQPGTVAVIPIIGTLTQRGDVINSMQTRSTDDIAAEARQAAAEPKIDAIVLEIDSPGGEVFGVPEAWTAIREAAKVKPVVAVASSQAASAALYLASAASEFYITPSGEAGSVGVYALHIDASKAIEDSGEKWEFIVADNSPHKVEGAPSEPLSDDARAEMKKTVNHYMAMFVRDVAKGRRVTEKAVLSRFGGGRMLRPQEAVDARMADGIGTLEQAIRRAGQLGRESRSAASAALHEVPVVADARPARASINEVPNLTEGTPERSCLSCAYYTKPAAGGSNGACSKYDFTASDAWVCDSFEIGKPEGGDDEPPTDSGAAARRSAFTRMQMR